MEDGYVVLGIIFVVIFVAFVTLGKIDKRRSLIKRVKASYGVHGTSEISRERYKQIAGYTDVHGESIDDITWNDLDMDRVFVMLNQTFSWVGESYLYYLLRNPIQSLQEMNRKKKFIEYFQENQDKGMEVKLYCATCGKRYNESTYVKILSILTKSPMIPVLDVVCMVELIVCAVWAAITGQEIIILLGAIGAFIAYFVQQANSEYQSSIIHNLVDLAKVGGRIGKLQLDVEHEFMKELEEDSKALKHALRFTNLIGKGTNGGASLEEMLIYYIIATTHIGNLQMYFAARRLHHMEETIERIIEKLGYLESMIVIASFRVAQPNYCEPEFTDKVALDVEGIYHPLITEPVVNAIKTEQKSILLTGSNASGKSTFLKTIALNAILAQTIHTCMATKYQAPIFTIYSSMSLRDSLEAQESYYIVEIKAIQRMLNHDYSNGPALCFVDEVFRGTNTMERIAAATEVLYKLDGEQSICFGATHDIELTATLEEHFDNYYFQEEIRDENIYFDYQLHRGIARTRNAIALLEMFGYDKEIVEGARARIDRFEKTKLWKEIL